ncbi:nickel/cobalt efflux protein RcnB [Cronobacter malonaticus]|uniref:Nickel/cobalt efflux protein RcnB n=2 Tax=Cronobacter malonaticus TaxID=413503 RepID=V5TXA9_9ENTR|nr:hypothetical protein P262_01994 [Cronobacter malonaticus]CCJ93314.1 FIG00553751: hypothetical protein [Cronobacter malonaticus 681]EGT4281091.1 nickel/cobalt efflux protein RcnB [Cronobacter malonaticus]EGT4288591.1 nickel/cobalt efflux protein RcnB [Cronobacter malonaticus]EGT4298990.1 nickel/cobalt efflux protein RcnB [Cronobacter malonaticus]
MAQEDSGLTVTKSTGRSALTCGEGMLKTRMIVAGVLLMSVASAFAADAVKPKSIDSYEVKEFHSDSKKYTIGDIVPDLYRTEQYNIKQWQIRNLPAPEAGTHWTYMGGYYVLITDADGKVVRAMNGDIFYHR